MILFLQKLDPNISFRENPVCIDSEYSKDNGQQSFKANFSGKVNKDHQPYNLKAEVILNPTNIKERYVLRSVSVDMEVIPDI